MRNKKFLWGVCEEILCQMYKETEPPLDFHRAVKQGITAKPNWFMNYYLPTKRQSEIFNEIIRKHKCSKYEERKISYEIWLGASPTGVKKDE